MLLSSGSAVCSAAAVVQRQAIIARNRARMAELELPELAARLCTAQLPDTVRPSRQAVPKAYKPRAPQPLLPMRHSARQRGDAPADVTNTVHEDLPARSEACKAGHACSVLTRSSTTQD